LEHNYLIHKELNSKIITGNYKHNQTMEFVNTILTI